MARREFLPLGEAHSSRNSRNARLRHPPLCFGRKRCGGGCLGLTIAIEAAWCGLGNENGD
ncbi:hypothetical protein LCM4577_23080 [Mesorhizobium sp. LCM 4577]|nr:hypothetical protein LCM4577_23080 [Mesorhizobium sp. LCM 4577]